MQRSSPVSSLNVLHTLHLNIIFCLCHESNSDPPRIVKNTSFVPGKQLEAQKAFKDAICL